MRRLVVVTLVGLLGLTGCVSVAQVAMPSCDAAGRNTLVLMAQSVPDAEHVPCIESLPAGWFINDMEIKSGHTRVGFSMDRSTSSRTVTMRFAARCEVGDAVEVPSDEPDARRFEDVAELGTGYRGTSYSVFQGGCVSLTFDVAGDGWSAVVNDASAAFALESRAELEQYVRTYSNGVIENL